MKEADSHQDHTGPLWQSVSARVFHAMARQTLARVLWGMCDRCSAGPACLWREAL